MGDKVEQKADAAEGSNIVQAARDIIYNGPTLPQVIETIDYQIDKQFPILLSQHAPQILEAEITNIRNEVNYFKDMLRFEVKSYYEKNVNNYNEEDFSKQLMEKLLDSNFQHLIKEATNDVVKKKQKSSKELLVNLLMEKMQQDVDDESYHIDMIIDSLKYLSKNHINFLTFHLLIRDYKPNYQGSNIKEYYEILVGNSDDENRKETIKQDIRLRVKNFYIRLINYFLRLEPKKVDIEFLEAQNLFFTERSYTKNLYDVIGTELLIDNPTENDIRQEIPELHFLYEMYGLKTKDEINYALSSLGRKISFQNYQIIKDNLSD